MLETAKKEQPKPPLSISNVNLFSGTYMHLGKPYEFGFEKKEPVLEIAVRTPQGNGFNHSYTMSQLFDTLERDFTRFYDKTTKIDIGLALPSKSM